MGRIAFRSLVLAAMVSGLWTATTSTSRAENLADSAMQKELAATGIKGTAKEPTRNPLMAQLFYPPVSDRQGVMVQGQGKASAPADTARIEFLFTNMTEPSEDPEGQTPSKPPKPITQATIRPVIDGIVALGVPASAIEVNTNPTDTQAFPFPIPTSEGAVQLLVRLEKPTRDRVQQIVKVAGDQQNLNSNVSLQSMNVQYNVNDCPALEKAAYAAAVNDARSRARALSEALGVKIADVPSIAESSFSLFNFFGSSGSSCGSTNTPIFPFSVLQRPYDPNAPAEVEVKKDIFVTYTVR